jgi:DmsE family decaheme c-type cytochrome
MVRPVSIDRVVSQLHRGPFVGGCVARVVVLPQLSNLAAAFLIAWLTMTPFVATANAVEANASSDSFSALREYAQLIDTARKPSGALDQNSANAAPKESSDATIAALREFAQQIGSNQMQSAAGLPKLADADNLLDFLRQGGSSSQPSVAPKGSAKSNGPIAGGTIPSAPVEASFVGAKVCVTCHATQADLFSHTLMGRIGKTQKGKFDCENCHGPGSAHVKAGGGRGVGGIISFRPEDRSRTAEENNAICLTCHQRGDRTNWSGSTHDSRGLMCTNCHTVMKQVSRKFQLKTVFEPDTCFQCHKDRRANMLRSSHMPQREGKMVCSDCHNPHGSFTEALLKKDSINDVCYTCHAEKRGPFLFEHLPVRENCDNCHDPHGSINEFSLKMSRPRLCFECHGAGHGSTSTVNSQTTMGRACQNCHTYVHGSNAPAGGALQR